MKRVFGMFVLICLCIGLAGCGDNGTRTIDEIKGIAETKMSTIANDYEITDNEVKENEDKLFVFSAVVKAKSDIKFNVTFDNDKKMNGFIITCNDVTIDNIEDVSGIIDDAWMSYILDDDITIKKDTKVELLGWSTTTDSEIIKNYENSNYKVDFAYLSPTYEIDGSLFKLEKPYLDNGISYKGISGEPVNKGMYSIIVQKK